MEIEIAPLNGGDLFLELLKKQVDKAYSSLNGLFRFLSNSGTLRQDAEIIWSFSDDKFRTPIFMQIIFPLNKPSENVSWVLFEDVIKNIKDNQAAKENILKSSKWYFSF